MQGSRYVKCNRLHKFKHHRHFTWCCKVNFKINPSCLEMKQSKSSSYNFKYLNYKDNY